MIAKVLVVDDEPDLETLVARRFRSHSRSGDWSFEFARDGHEAIVFWFEFVKHLRGRAASDAMRILLAPHGERVTLVGLVHLGQPGISWRHRWDAPAIGQFHVRAGRRRAESGVVAFRLERGLLAIAKADGAQFGRLG